MNKSIAPALTREEWAKQEATREPSEATYSRVGHTGVNRDAVCIVSRYGSGCTDDPEALHALAAFCLDGRPFGFTQDEARVVLKYVEHVGCNCGDNQCHAADDSELLASAASKIAALLPPPDVAKAETPS